MTFLCVKLEVYFKVGSANCDYSQALTELNEREGRKVKNNNAIYNNALS